MTLNDLSQQIHDTAVAHGFWDSDDRNFGEMVALIRILDTVWPFGADLDAVTQHEMDYNASRPRMHGKAY